MGASMTEESVQASSKNGSLFLRKVEFHLARKPTSYLPVSSSSDFKLETLTPSTSATTSTSDPYTQYLASNFPLTAPKKSESSNFVDYGFGAEFNHRIPFKRIGAGLENLGNTCFLNSVLQCLTYTEPLVAYLQSGRHQTSCRIAGFCALCAIQKHVSRALQSSGRSLAPKDLVSNLRCISRSFRNARQEDAHEYMIQLLEAMHKCCLPSGVPTESPNAYEKSLVHKIFGGRLRSQVKCMQCSYCSNKFDPFLDLSLEIMKADSLYKALLHFTAAEQLDGGQRQYNCERCKKKVKALKQLTVHKAPYVLTIHLKRFGSHVTGQKIDKKVQFGPALDLKPFLSGPYDGDLKYTLYGVLVHAGWSTHSGHYYCFVRTSTGMWYSLDDNRVYQVSEKSVLNQKAYMLFYVRDKNNFSSKKPIDVTQKGSIFEATVQNNSFPAPENHCSGIQHNTILKCLRESGSGQNGSISKQSNGSNSHDIPVQQKGSIVVSSSKACPKEFVEHCDEIILSECLVHKEKTVVWKSDAQAATHTTTCTDGRPSGTQFMTAASADVNEDKCYKSDLLASEAKRTGVDCLANILDDANLVPQASKLDNIAAANVLSDQNNAVSMNIDRNKSSCQKLNCAPLVYHNLMSEKNDCNKASNQPTNDQIERANAIAKVASGHFAKDKLKKKKKKKKKLFMGKGVSMHLSRNILYGTFLSLQKRKNLRRTKRQAVNAHLNSKEHCISADVGPHASDRLTSSSNGSYKHSHKRDHTSGSSKSDIISVLENLKNGTGILQKEIFERKIPEMQCQNNSCSLLSGEQLVAQKPEVSKACVNDEVHTSDINTLTANLCETRIGHWDGVDLPPGIPEWKGLDDFQIGHVGDEWDEEYDRGKRKKVRQSRIGFGGSNPFQEIALKKAKLKR